MGIRGDDRPRPRSTTRAEAELRSELLDGTINLATFNRRFNKLKKIGLITRNGKVIR